MTARRRPVKTDNYVWCDYHCEIHGREVDFYQEHAGDPLAILDGRIHCEPTNWRSVYVLGDQGEEF